MADASAIDFLARELIANREEMQALRQEIARITTPAADRLLSRARVAERLGVTLRTVDRMVGRGELAPGRLVGKRLRWTQAQIEEAAKG